jgi:hypothetical protein
MEVGSQKKRGRSKQKLHNCVICLDDIKVVTYNTPCGHYFHRRCVLPWIKAHNSCPICRKSIDKNKPIILCSANDIDEDYEYALNLQNEMIIQEIEYNMNHRRRHIRIRYCFNCDSDICICREIIN